MDDFNIGQQSSPEKANKKRKVDKDGFVCPSSFDIPKSSNQYTELTDEGLDSLADTHHYGTDTFNSGDTVSSYFHTEQVENHEPEYLVADADSLPSDQGAANQYEYGSNSLMQSLIDEFSKETLQLFDEWSVTLRQSEEFESECPRKLDVLIHEAREIETSLNDQKNALCQRLKGLGQVLRSQET